MTHSKGFFPLCSLICWLRFVVASLLWYSPALKPSSPCISLTLSPVSLTLSCGFKIIILILHQEMWFLSLVSSSSVFSRNLADRLQTFPDFSCSNGSAMPVIQDYYSVNATQDHEYYIMQYHNTIQDYTTSCNTTIPHKTAQYNNIVLLQAPIITFAGSSHGGVLVRYISTTHFFEGVRLMLWVADEGWGDI